MTAGTPDSGVLQLTKSAEHSACFLCGAANPAGFQLAFALEPDGTVRADVLCPRTFQSYEGTLHGGVECPIDLDSLRAVIEKKFGVQVILGTHSY